MVHGMCSANSATAQTLAVFDTLTPPTRRYQLKMVISQAGGSLPSGAAAAGTSDARQTHARAFRFANQCNDMRPSLLLLFVKAARRPSYWL